MDSRLDKRLKSVRSLPNGKFEFYRKMFDKNKENEEKIKKNVFTKNDDFYEDDELEELKKNDILQLPYTDDEKSSHLLQTTKNNGSKFGIYSSKIDDKIKKTQRYSLNIDSYSKSIENYKPKLITVLDENNNDKIVEDPKPAVQEEIKKVKDKKDFFEKRMSVLHDDVKITNLVKNKNLSKSCNFNKELFESNIKIQKPVYVDFDDIDLSDTSYDDESDNNSVKQNNNKINDHSDLYSKPIKIMNKDEDGQDSSDDSKNQYDAKKPPLPPPKPKRTFEHDIYVKFKIDLNKTFDTSTLVFDTFNNESPPKLTSLGGKSIASEHIYETLGSVQQFVTKLDSDDFVTRENNNKFGDSDSFGATASPALSRSSNQSQQDNISKTIGGFNKKVIF
jgi:hypothetical protein